MGQIKQYFDDLFTKLRQSKTIIVIFILAIALNLSLYTFFITENTEANLSNIYSWFVSMIFAFGMYKVFIIKDNDYSPPKIWNDFIKFFFKIMIFGIISIAFFYEFYSRGVNQPIFGIDGFSTKIIVIMIELALNLLDSIDVELPKKRKIK